MASGTGRRPAIARSAAVPRRVAKPSPDRPARPARARALGGRAGSVSVPGPPHRERRRGPASPRSCQRMEMALGSAVRSAWPLPRSASARTRPERTAPAAACRVEGRLDRLSSQSPRSTTRRTASGSRRRPPPAEGRRRGGRAARPDRAPAARTRSASRPRAERSRRRRTISAPRPPATIQASSGSMPGRPSGRHQRPDPGTHRRAGAPEVPPQPLSVGLEASRSTLLSTNACRPSRGIQRRR